ncbi:MAG: recombinase family protein [Firmicutes bacterium]|nr:recombinase family protein [Bacillota bacterium]
MTKAAAYLRVSTEGQVGDDKFGLAAQRQAVEEYAKAQGLELVAWYEDDGISGGTLDRPGLMALLAAAKAHEFKVVVVAKMDRVARDLMAQLWIEKELLKAEVELVSAAEPFRGNDPANVLFRQIIGAFAQFEKARIAERMTGGRRQKAARGGYSGGGAPTGYRARRGAKALEVDPDAARLVLRVFALRDAEPNASLQALADRLNAEGFTGPKGGRIFAMQVKRILDRRAFYEGHYRYAGIEAQGQHAPLLGKATA